MYRLRRFIFFRIGFTAAKLLRSLRGGFVKGYSKSGAGFVLRHRFVICYSLIFFFYFLHRLVGLRLLRLCPFLVSEVEQEIYSAKGFAPRPHKPSSAGLDPALYCSLRSVLPLLFLYIIIFSFSFALYFLDISQAFH